MATELEPLVDQWYQHLDKGQKFTVVAIDDVTERIELQHFDGDLEEISFDEWSEFQLDLCDEPDNWIGALDIGELDDMGTEITDTDEDDLYESFDEFNSYDEEQANEY